MYEDKTTMTDESRRTRVTNFLFLFFKSFQIYVYQYLNIIYKIL